MSVSSLATLPELEVGDIEDKILSGPDEDGELLGSLKVMVTSYADSEQRVLLEIQGCDGGDFEVFETRLEGKIGPKETETITDLEYIDEEIYQSIAQWKVER